MSFESTQQERAKRLGLRLEHRRAMALRDSANGGWRVFRGTAMRDFNDLHDPHIAHFSEKKSVEAWLDGFEAAIEKAPGGSGAPMGLYAAQSHDALYGAVAR